MLTLLSIRPRRLQVLSCRFCHITLATGSSSSFISCQLAPITGVEIEFTLFGEYYVLVAGINCSLSNRA
jgi:hypothetical protein